MYGGGVRRGTESRACSNQRTPYLNNKLIRRMVVATSRSSFGQPLIGACHVHHQIDPRAYER